MQGIEAPPLLNPAPTLRKSGILVVDNDSLIRSILRSVLLTVTDGGTDLIMAASGLEAVAHAGRHLFRLVLLDLNMPGMNGLMVCAKLRVLPGYADTPIIIISALHGEDARVAATRVGANGFISKPFQPASMLRLVAPYLLQ